MITVTVSKPRPDFRVIIDLLFGPDRNVDSDGDSDPVYSRHWHDLYLNDRESDTAHIHIFADDGSPILFDVSSESSRFEELAAIYLYDYCGDNIERGGQVLTEKKLKSLRSKYAEELRRAEHSRWHNSSADDPYPP